MSGSYTPPDNPNLITPFDLEDTRVSIKWPLFIDLVTFGKEVSHTTLQSNLGRLFRSFQATKTFEPIYSDRPNFSVSDGSIDVISVDDDYVEIDLQVSTWLMRYYRQSAFKRKRTTVPDITLVTNDPDSASHVARVCGGIEKVTVILLRECIYNYEEVRLDINTLSSKCSNVHIITLPEYGSERSFLDNGNYTSPDLIHGRDSESRTQNQHSDYDNTQEPVIHRTPSDSVTPSEANDLRVRLGNHDPSLFVHKKKGFPCRSGFGGVTVIGIAVQDHITIRECDNTDKFGRACVKGLTERFYQKKIEAERASLVKCLYYILTHYYPDYSDPIAEKVRKINPRLL